MNSDTSVTEVLPRVILHIGTTKTGTSSLQQFCRDNADALAEQGVCYPRSPGNHRHYKLSLFLTPPEELESTLKWKQSNLDEPMTFRRRLRRNLIREAGESACDQILLSDEALYAKGPMKQRRLRDLLRQFSSGARIVVYLRRQDDHMVSRYQQQVKQGLPLRMSDYALEAREWKYDYFAQLSAWRRNLDPTDVVVRCYEPRRFAGGSLQADFMDTLDIDLDLTGFSDPVMKNRSLDAATVEFIRLLNLYQIEHRGETSGNIDNRRWWRRAQEQATGKPTLTLPDSELDDFMALWHDSNRKVARKLLGKKDGELFSEPRRQSNTQTDQRLDPSRLDYFFELMDVPEEWHREIRAIGEREARRS